MSAAHSGSLMHTIKQELGGEMPQTHLGSGLAAPPSGFVDSTTFPSSSTSSASTAGASAASSAASSTRLSPPGAGSGGRVQADGGSPGGAAMGQSGSGSAGAGAAASAAVAGGIGDGNNELFQLLEELQNGNERPFLSFTNTLLRPDLSNTVPI